jgi:hypothetical protein
MRWNVYYWKAGKQFLIGDCRQIIDLVGPSQKYFTRRYTLSRRPKTLTFICDLDTFLARSESLKKSMVFK